MKGHLDVKELETYKKADLQKLARELGVSDAGTIKEIAERCAAVEVEAPEEAELTEGEKKAAAEAEAAAKDEEERKAAEVAAKDEEVRKAAAAAGMVKVEVTTRYLDKRLNQIKDAGEIFTVHKDRAAELVSAKVAKIKE